MESQALVEEKLAYIMKIEVNRRIISLSELAILPCNYSTPSGSLPKLP